MNNNYIRRIVMSEQDTNIILTSLHSRRSIRHFTKTPVTDDQITQIISAAMSAPSAGNEQPWEFIVIRNSDTFTAIQQFHPYAQMLKEASAAIVVCGNMAHEKFKGFWVQDCSAASQNILLAAHAMGLGSVWLGIYPMEDRVEGLSKLLNLPPAVIPLSLIPIGFPDEQKEVINRLNPSRIHNEKW